MKVELNKKRNRMVIITICVIEAIMCAYFLCHLDTLPLMSWTREMIKAIIDGQIMEYVDIVNATGIPINYSIVPIFVMSIGMVPFYNFETIFGLTGLYLFGWKTLVLILFLVSFFVFDRILYKLDFSLSKRIIGDILFSTYPAVLIEIVGRGQIDFLAIVFLLLGVYFYIDNKFHIMSLMFGLSILVKPFGILIFGTIICLTIFQKKWRVVLYLTEFGTLYVVDFILTRLIYPNYSLYIDAYYTNPVAYDFVGRLFEVNLFGIPVYIVGSCILVGVCIWMSYKRLNSYEIVFSMTAVMCTMFVVLVRWNNNWIPYFLPIIIIASLYFLRYKELIISYFISSLAYIAYIIVYASAGTFGKVVSFWMDIPSEWNLINATLAEKLDGISYFRNCFLIIFDLVLLYIVIKTIIQLVRKRENNISKTASVSVISMGLMFVPSAIYLILSYVAILML